MANFVYTRKDLVVGSVAMAIVIVLLGVGFGVASGKAAGAKSSSEVRFGPDASWEENVAMALKLLGEAPVLDGHNDFPLTIRAVTQNNLSAFDFNSDLSQAEGFKTHNACHTDLPKLRQGRVGGQFWSAYVDCSAQYKDAVQMFIEQIDVIHRLVEKYPDDMIFVTNASQIETAFEYGKIASLIGVESGHAIGSSLAVLRMLYDLGARYMTLTHSCNTPWADSSESEKTIPPEHYGLSDFGKLVVEEMNRLGMLVDISHVSKDTMADALEVSVAPVIFSHSSARAVTNLPRNVPDEILSKMPDNGGVVMVNFYSCFVSDNCEQEPATVTDIVKHINHIRNISGVDHIGIGADYNGVENLPLGFEDVSNYPKLFAYLLQDGWSPEDLKKLSSGNIIRVLKEAERVRDQLRAKNGPIEDWIEPKFLEGHMECMSEMEEKRK